VRVRFRSTTLEPLKWRRAAGAGSPSPSPRRAPVARLHQRLEVVEQIGGALLCGFRNPHPIHGENRKQRRATLRRRVKHNHSCGIARAEPIVCAHYAMGLCTTATRVSVYRALTGWLYLLARRQPFGFAGEQQEPEPVVACPKPRVELVVGVWRDSKTVLLPTFWRRSANPRAVREPRGVHRGRCTTDRIGPIFH
jgi:hypothetical protein